MIKNHCDQAKSNLYSIQNLAEGLRGIKNKKDIKKLQGMLDEFDTGIENAINNIEQIESMQKSRESKIKRGGTMKSKRNKSRKSRHNDSTEEGVDKIQLYRTQKTVVFNNKFNSEEPTTKACHHLRNSEAQKQREDYDFLDDQNDDRYFTAQKKKRSKSKSHRRRNSDYLVENTRTTLPAYKTKTTINVFKILKDSIGKDLTKFSVPVYFNEPLSMLQRT